MPIPVVAAIARHQYGLVHRRQLLEAGIPERTIATWSALGRLEPRHPGVYRSAGAPRSFEQDLLAAVLSAGPGAAASHRAGAHLFSLHDEPLVEITVPYPRRPRLQGVTLHRSKDLRTDDVTVRRGVPVTNPLRVLVDLGAVVPMFMVRDALERGLVARLFTVAGAEAAWDRVAKRGRNGSGVLRRVLDDRALGADRPDGLLEPRMALVLRRHGLPPAMFQFCIYDGHGRLVARVDFAYPTVKLAIEVDGWSAHATPEALQRDLERQNALVALGWRVIRFTWHDVVRQPAKVAAEISRHLRALTAA